MRPLTQIVGSFAYQSHFGTARILQQGVGDPIVGSTKQTGQTPGIGFALHPCSQSPVAIKLRGGQSDSAELVLTPGQKIITGRFTGFDWGLPFGWLGGGRVVLYVIHREDANVSFPSARPAIIFHRLRLTVVNGAADAAPIVNWPLQFPWSNAVRVVAGSNQPQPAGPVFTIEPEATLFKLNTSPFNADVALTLQIRNCDPFDLQAAGAAGYANVNQFYALGFQSVNGRAQVAWLPAEVARLAGDSAAVSILDTASVLGGETVDVVRYGRLM